MANRTMTLGATYPPLRVSVQDKDGLVDLTTADLVESYLKSSSKVISGTMNVIDPPETVTIDGEEVEVNAEYGWDTGDTDITGVYTVRTKVTWDSGASPPLVEYFPDAVADADILTIEAL